MLSAGHNPSTDEWEIPVAAAVEEDGGSVTVHDFVFRLRKVRRQSYQWWSYLREVACCLLVTDAAACVLCVVTLRAGGGRATRGVLVHQARVHSSHSHQLLLSDDRLLQRTLDGGRVGAKRGLIVLGAAPRPLRPLLLRRRPSSAPTADSSRDSGVCGGPAVLDGAA